jgi:hypothetical protein
MIALTRQTIYGTLLTKRWVSTRVNLDVEENIEHCEHFQILPAALGPGVYLASNRNEYQNRKIIMFLGIKGRPVRRADNLAAI